MDGLISQLADLDQQKQHYRFNRRILINPKLISQLQLITNQLVLIKPSTTQPLSLEKLNLNNLRSNDFGIGFIWPSNHSTNPNIVQLSYDILLSAKIEPGQTISLKALPPIIQPQPGIIGINLPVAELIQLQPIQPPQLITSPLPTNHLTQKLWLAYIKELIIDRQYLAINHYISIPFENQLCFFKVQAIQPIPSEQQQSLQLYQINRNTQVIILNHQPTTTTKPIDQIGYDAIGGLQPQIDQIRDLVELPLTRPELYSHFAITPPRGILLYGPPGTGKTHLASIIAKSTNSTLLTLSTATISSAYHGEPEQKIYEIFAQAKLNSPTIILIDEIDGLFPNRELGGDVDRRMVGALLTAMDGIDQKQDEVQPSRVLVIATTNRPHSLDPALRRPGRFDRELEIGIPDAQGRLEILKVLLRKVPNQLTPDQTREMADKTHGFVGADLVALLREAGLGAIKRSLANQIPIDQMSLDHQDLTKALLTVQPSAMRELVIESPRVTWEDIGGQVSVKQRLTEALSWPSQYPQTFQRLGIKPIRGILLYGPPGCSKTLIAKALASQSNANFIAIKGSDVFNKFLGESEKSIRDLFRKARAASPSIIFLDEIDSIAMARGSDDQGGGGTGVADRVLTSLLVEMDGIEELTGVLVLAATNRPEVIDPALMRPGRLDRILYVGPPDLHSRAEILRINFRKMSVDPHLDIHNLATLTEGCTGAEIVAVCQEAAINAIHRDKDVQFIVEEDFLKVLQSFKKSVGRKVLDGYERWRDGVGVQSA